MKACKDFLHIRLVVFRVLRVDKDVVKVRETDDIQEVSKGIVDVPLEGCRSIRESKGEDDVLKMTVAGSEGRLPFMPGLNPNEVIGLPDVKFTEDLRSLQSIEQFADKRKGYRFLTVTAFRSL